jgi:hypothetical protein
MISESHISFDFERFFIYLKVIGNLKTVIIMANIVIKFIDLFYNDDFMTIQKKNHKTTNKDYIHIVLGTQGNEDENKEMMLDKSTAIKLAKTLRTEINKIKS